MNSRITWPLFSGQTSINSRITRPLMYLYQTWRPLNSRNTSSPYLKSDSGNLEYYLATLYKNSYTPKNSRITLPPYFVSECGTCAYYLATLYKKFLYSYEYAYYLASII